MFLHPPSSNIYDMFTIEVNRVINGYHAMNAMVLHLITFRLDTARLFNFLIK